MQIPRLTADGSGSDIVVLPPAAARRLSNQIGRAFRGTYEATTGLRTIVRSIAIPLLEAGASEDAVARAFEQCVLTHPARLADDPRTLLARSEMIVEVTRSSVAGAAVDLEHAS